MKITKMSKTLFTTTLLIFALNFIAFGQSVFGVVEYIKADNPKEFLEIEKEWHRIYKQLIQQEKFDGCSVYQVLYKTKEEDYNYIRIYWFDSFTKIFKIRNDQYKDAYPELSKDGWKKFQKRTENAGDVVTSSVVYMEASCANGLDKEGSFYKINELDIKPENSKQYYTLVKDIYLPIYQEAVNDNQRTAWSFWAKWTGNTDNFEYYTADGYESLDQIDQDRFNEIFRELFPDKNIQELSDQMNTLKTLVNSEMWKLVYRILK